MARLQLPWLLGQSTGMRPVVQSTRPGGAQVNGLFERHSKLSRSNVPASPQLGLGSSPTTQWSRAAHGSLNWRGRGSGRLHGWGDAVRHFPKDIVRISTRRSVLPEAVRLGTVSRRKLPNALADPGFLLGPSTPQSDRELLAQGCGCPGSTLHVSRPARTLSRLDLPRASSTPWPLYASAQC